MDQILNLSRKDEERLIRKASDGCLDSFEALMAAHSDKLSGFIYKQSGKTTETDEVYQVTQIKAWKHIKKFKCDSSFYTWLCRIATNLIIDNYRKNVKGKTVFFSDLEIGEQDDKDHFFGVVLSRNNLTCENGGDKLIDRRILRGLMGKCMGEISYDHRNILKMFFFRSMKYEEIAKELGISVGTVMSRLFHAKKNMGKVFKTKYRDYGFKD